jgi:hypothetical protein
MPVHPNIVSGYRLRAGAGVFRVWGFVLPFAIYEMNSMTATAPGKGFGVPGHACTAFRTN